MALTKEQIQERLVTERNIWFASVRANGAPHLIPIWFVTHAGLIYICTDPTSVKIRNVRHNPRVALSLEDGSAPVIIEGGARVMDNADAPAVVAEEFKSKYDWDIMTSKQYRVVIEVTPKKTLNWVGE
jgi:F420H(2)-dependent biliverdin reductase